MPSTSLALSCKPPTRALLSAGSTGLAGSYGLQCRSLRSDAQGSRALSAAPSRLRQKAAGYTLVEMMTIVMIVGVLATLATYSVRKYIYSAKASEAFAMITEIKAAEESYRDEMFVYAGLGAFNAWHPAADPADGKAAWQESSPTAATTIFSTLGVVADGPVFFRYTVVSGTAAEAVVSPPTEKTDFNFPSPAGAPWYVVVAKADLDGDGVSSYALAHSFSNEIYTEREGE